MKRSEMIKKIEIELKAKSSFLRINDRAFAVSESILKLVERMGMLPPLMPIREYDTYGNELESYEWEREDVQTLAGVPYN